MTKFLFPTKKINNNLFKKYIQDLLEKVTREKKKFYEFKNSESKNSEPIATNNNGETQGKFQTTQHSF